MNKFKRGDQVRLKTSVLVGIVPKNNPTAVVSHNMGNHYPGGVAMEEDLRGHLYWNEDDLDLVTEGAQ